MAEYPTKKMKETSTYQKGHSGNVIKTGIENTPPEMDSIRTNSMSKNKKSAGNVGSGSITHS